MVNGGSGLGFSYESLVGYRISLKTHWQELQGNLTLQGGVFG